MQHLVVVRPFGPWRVGDVVSDGTAIANVLRSEFRNHVVQSVVADAGAVGPASVDPAVSSGPVKGS